MMKIFKAVTLLAGILFTITVYSQSTSSEVMINRIFTVLHNKDEKGFINLFPDAAITRRFILKIFNTDSTDEEKLKQLNELTSTLTDSSLREKLKESYNDIISLGEKKGIDWSATSFLSYKADSTIEKSTFVSTLQGKIYFLFGEKEYFMAFSEVIWFDGLGWYGVDIDRVDLKERENQEEDFVWDTTADSTLTDSAMNSTDTLVVLPEKIKTVPKPLNKPKAPVKKTAKKTIVPSPAKKPE